MPGRLKRFTGPALLVKAANDAYNVLMARRRQNALIGSLMKIEFCSLNSGSNGNATYIAAGNTRVLVDAGLSGQGVSKRLAQLEVLPETISAIVISHEHADHVRGAGVLSRKYRIPVYATQAAWQTDAMRRLVGQVPPGLMRVFNSGEEFYIGDIGIQTIPIPHDTVDPVAFRLYAGSRSVAVATDMGRVPRKVLRGLSGADLILLESNHDPDMLLHNALYPEHLKQRILGGNGHLSNLDCARTLLELVETGVQHAVLGHLSHDNNTPELALQTVSEQLSLRGVRPGTDIRLDMAWRDRIGGVYTLE